MPFYRVNGVMVHMRGTKLPAACVARITYENPVVPSTRCCAISTFLCDFELEDGKTCDAPLCPEHARQVGPDRHLCPRHALAADAQPELFR